MIFSVLYRFIAEYHNIPMSFQILALLVLVALLGHVALISAASIEEQSLDASLETGPEINDAVENEQLEEDERLGPLPEYNYLDPVDWPP